MATTGNHWQWPYEKATAMLIMMLIYIKAAEKLVVIMILMVIMMMKKPRSKVTSVMVMIKRLNR